MSVCSEAEERVAPAALQQMRERGGLWAAYQNMVMDSSLRGHLQFLKVGAGCTYEIPPETYPANTEHGTGWKYLLRGLVNLEDGTILPAAPSTT